MAENSLKSKKWGQFSDDGKEFIITNPKTPYPWVNIICPDEYGVAISQSGGGFSWYKSARLMRINRWQPCLYKEDGGKFIIIEDEKTKEKFSPTPYPLGEKVKNYCCRHGLGYSVFSGTCQGTRTELLIFVPPESKFEVHRLKIKNTSNRKKSYAVTFFLQFWMGTHYEVERELHRLFYRESVKNKVVWMEKVAWQVANEKGQFLNRKFPAACFLASLPLAKKINLNMDLSEPISEITTKITVDSNKEKEIIFLVGVCENKQQGEKIIKENLAYTKIEKLFSKTQKFWIDIIGDEKAQTKDKNINHILSYWLKYQTISSRFYGKTGYYQIGGAIGFRDQLQDSMLFLRTKPQITKKQILLHASKQFKKGDVAHFWDPVTGEFARLRISDNLLWLVFVVLEYIRFTNDYSILEKKVGFLDGGSASLKEHCLKAIKLVLERRSKRGIPLILAGDWNDGLSAVGWEGEGESFWLGMFLYKILKDWNKIISARLKSENFSKAAEELKNSINKFGWDGDWFLRATKANGEPIGSRKCKSGKIFLNSQTWAIISGITTKDRVKKILKSLDKYLYYPYGPLLLYPAYKKPDAEIGYLTRYAPGTRENGAVYMHAASWAIWAEILADRKNKAWQIFESVLPICQNQKKLWAEPYVTSANIEGPDSTHPGRGSWSWYTGSAQWLLKIFFEYLNPVSSHRF